MPLQRIQRCITKPSTEFKVQKEKKEMVSRNCRLLLEAWVLRESELRATNISAFRLFTSHSRTYVQDWTQVLFKQYFIFGRVIWHFHIASYLTEMSVFWWPFTNEDTLWCLSWDIISFLSWTHLHSRSARWLHFAGVTRAEIWTVT